MMPPAPGSLPQGSPTGGGRPKKYTCKLEIGIENEGEFRVGSRVIQIARQIWQDEKFQQHGGKTRLRGKGIGGPHEADEQLNLQNRICRRSTRSSRSSVRRRVGKCPIYRS